MTKTTEIPLSTFAVPTADINMNARKLTNVAAPAAGSDAATKQYVDDSLVRGKTTKTATATLTDAEVLGGLVVLETNVDNQALTLPAAASGNSGADLFVSFKPTAPAAAATLVCAAGFHCGGAGDDTLTFAPHEGCHVFSDGASWYLLGAGPGCTLG